jgi:CHAT domain-containing protein
MSEFYQQLSKRKLSKARALQNAQLSLLKQARYRHPIYWGPYLLIGNWL